MTKRTKPPSIEKGRAAPAFSVGEAVLAHLDALYRFALRLTRNKQLAEELVQESVVRALEQNGSRVGNLRAWLFQTLYHRFIDSYRRVIRLAAKGEDAGADFTNLAQRAPDRGIMEDVRRSLEALPEELRVVVWLSDGEDFRLREIAEMLGWPLGTVASRLARGREELRRLLSAYGPSREKEA